MTENYYESRGDKFLRIFSNALIVFVIFMAFVFFTFLGIFVSAYNNLVNLQENVTLAESDIEEMMQKRLELIPNLVETVEAHTKKEEQVFKDVLNAQETLAEILYSKYDLEKIGEANDNLTIALNKLIATAEANPELLTDENYIELMKQLQERVNKISDAREKYNKAVYDYNRNIKYFPGSIFAPVLGFTEIEYFQADGQASSINLANLEE